MSEKRFTSEISSFSSDYLKFARVYDNGKLIGTDEMVVLLNEQQDQIHRDELSIKTMLTNMEKLEKENEALKKFIKDNFNEMMDSKLVIDDE